jgi:hypothetical protein
MEPDYGSRLIEHLTRHPYKEKTNMKLHNCATSLGLGLLLLIELSGSAAARQRVPFKGRLDGTVTITPASPSLEVLIEATGNATHLGDFTLVVPHLVNPATRTGTGSYEFTAANGDMLFADFTGSATQIAPGLLRLVETATITGGSGRFAEATGSFTCERIFNMAAGTTTGSFEGTIFRNSH